MAAINPVSKGTPGWLQPGVIMTQHPASAPNILASGRAIPRAGLREQWWYFDDIDTNERWNFLPAGCVAFATWVSDAAAEGGCTMNVNRQLLWAVGPSAPAWLVTWSRGSISRAASASNFDPVGRGTNNFLSPYNAVRKFGPGYTTVTAGATKPRRYRHRTFYFSGVGLGSPDTWSSPPHGTIALAWQANGLPDSMLVAVTGSTVEFFSGGNRNGWLHTWSAY